MGCTASESDLISSPLSPSPQSLEFVKEHLQTYAMYIKSVAPKRLSSFRRTLEPRLGAATFDVSAGWLELWHSVLLYWRRQRVSCCCSVLASCEMPPALACVLAISPSSRTSPHSCTSPHHYSHPPLASPPLPPSPTRRALAPPTPTTPTGRAKARTTTQRAAREGQGPSRSTTPTVALTTTMGLPVCPASLACPSRRRRTRAGRGARRRTWMGMWMGTGRGMRTRWISAGRGTRSSSSRTTGCWGEWPRAGSWPTRRVKGGGVGWI